MNTTTDCCSLDFSDTGRTSTLTSQSSSEESSAHIIDEEETMINMQQETPSFDSCSRNMNLKTKKYSLYEHVLLLKSEHQNRIMKSKSDRTALRESSAVCNYLNYKAVKSDRTSVVHHEENNVTQSNQRLPQKNYIPDPVWDEHRRRYPTKKEQVVAKRPQTKEQHVHLPVVLEKTQIPPPTLDRWELLQRTKSFPDRRRSSLLRQHSFPRGLQDSNRYNYQDDFLQDEIDFEEKFLLPDEDIRRAECHKTMLPYSSPRILGSRHTNKANISLFLFNSSLLWNSFKHSLKRNGAGLTMKVPKEILSIIKILPGNDCCFDCNSRHDLVWAFVPHGTILCESCGFEHLRKVHDDDILSFSGDLDWKFKELISLLEGGNKTMLSFLKQRSIENREHENVAKAMKENDFGSLYNSKTASQYRKLIRKKVQIVVRRYHDGISCTD